MLLQVFFAVLEYVTDTVATPLKQQTRSLIQTMVTWKRKIYDASCLSKMMILLMFVLCCYVVQVSVAVLVSSREDFLVFIWK